MATISNALGLEVLALVTGDTPHLALYTSDPTIADTGAEVTNAGGSTYARQAVTFGTPVGVSVDNTNVVEFNDMPLATITHWAIRDALTGGNLKMFGAFTPSIPMQLHDKLHFAVGDITLGIN